MRATTWLISLALAMAATTAGAADPAPAPTASAATPITQVELLARQKQDPHLVVLDVRTPEEFAAGHVPGARNVPHDLIPARLAELAPSKEKPLVLYCRTGRRTTIAVRTLREAGFTQLLHLEGDWQAWEAAKQPIERQPAP